MSEVTVIGCPKRDQQRPLSLLHRLRAHVAFLVVAREVQRWLQHCADESLMIVGGRIDQMSEELLAGPATRQDGPRGFRF